MLAFLMMALAVQVLILAIQTTSLMVSLLKLLEKETTSSIPHLLHAQTKNATALDIGPQTFVGIPDLVTMDHDSW